MMIARINRYEKMTSLGNKLGEEIISAGKYSVGKRYFAEILTIIQLGIPLISSVGEFDELRWGRLSVAIC